MEKTNFINFCGIANFDEIITSQFLLYVYYNKLENKNEIELSEFIKKERTITEWQFICDGFLESLTIVKNAWDIK